MSCSSFYPQTSDFLGVIWMLLMLVLVLKLDFAEDLTEIFFPHTPAPKIVFSQNWEFPNRVFTFWNADLLEYQAFYLFLLTSISLYFNPFSLHSQCAQFMLLFCSFLHSAILYLLPALFDLEVLKNGKKKRKKYRKIILNIICIFA